MAAVDLEESGDLVSVAIVGTIKIGFATSWLQDLTNSTVTPKGFNRVVAVFGSYNTHIGSNQPYVGDHISGDTDTVNLTAEAAGLPVFVFFGF